MKAPGWHQILLDTGAHFGRALASLVVAADPQGQVLGRNLHLCAALGALSQSCYDALSTDPVAREAVGRAGALLSLLTKVDDQVIDSLDFHGGWRTPRVLVRARTRAFLQPTLDSIRLAAPASRSPRCALAAELGSALSALSADPARLERLLAVIARGWQIQIEAVALLSAHPATTTDAQLSWVTRQISGAWLLMIAMVGALPASVPVPLSPEEEQAFYGWGGWIQRADALADISKDAADGLINSVPARHIWRQAPEAYEAALRSPGTEQLYALLAETGADAACLPPPGALAALSSPLSRLGAVPGLLAWIQGFLTWRYLAAPQCRQAVVGTAWTPYITHTAGWRAYAEGAACSAP
ncbi:MAG: hypothetical protein ACI8S6_005202 [Myxococcota bacterium]|jgi:hypothetical protein